MTASSVSEALGQITSQKFDVLISDLNMGHMADGFTVVHTMRRVNPDCINFILTGYPAFESALQALREQVDDYLTKPSDVPKLLDAINRKLQRRSRSVPRPLQRFSTILRDNIETITSRVLVNMKAVPELAAMPLTDEQRLDRVPLTLVELADHIESNTPNDANDVLTESARLRGEQQFRQGYSLKLMVECHRIITQVINNVVYENLLAVNLSYLLLDLNKLNDAMLLQVEESIAAYEAERRRPN